MISVALPLFTDIHHRRPLPDWSGMICPWWSCAGCFRSFLHIPWSLLEVFSNFNDSMFLLLYNLPRHQSEAQQPAFSWVFLSPVHKNGSDISLFPVTRDFTWQPRLFEYGSVSWQFHEQVSLEPWDACHWAPKPCTFSPTRQSQTCSSLIVEGILFSQSSPRRSVVWRM